MRATNSPRHETASNCEPHRFWRSAANVVSLLSALLGCCFSAAEANQWKTGGPYGGSVELLAADSAGILFAAGNNRAYRSLDNGSHWLRLDEPFLNLGTNEINDFRSIDTSQAGTVYLCCVVVGADSNSMYVVRSVDGGGTWSIGQNSPGSNLSQVAADPGTLGTLYAAVPLVGIFKSTNSGDSWSQIGSGTLPNSPMINSLIVDASTSPSTLYAGEDTHGIYKSTDAGSTWGPADGDLPSFFIQVGALAIDRLNPATLYAVLVVGGATRSLYKTTDGGATTFSLILSDPSVRAIAVDPADSENIYIGTTHGAMISADSGTSFPTVTTVPQISVNAIAFQPGNFPASSTAYFGTQTGVFETPDLGASANAKNNGLALTSISAVVPASDPSQPATIYAAALGAGIFKSYDSGGSWNSIYVGDATPSSPSCNTNAPLFHALAIDASNTLYAATECTQNLGVLKSEDGGTSWAGISTGLPDNVDVFAIAVDPLVAGSVVAGTHLHGLYASANGGDSWNAVDSIPSDADITSIRFQSVAALGISPPSRVDVTTLNYGTFVSQDGGASYASLDLQVDSVLRGWDVAISPRVSGSSTGLPTFEALDDGPDLGVTIDALMIVQHWAVPDGNPFKACAPAYQLVLDPNDPNGFYAGSACGVLHGTNLGQQVVSMNQDLPADARVKSMARSRISIIGEPSPPPVAVLYAGMQVGGVYQYAFEEIFASGFE